MTTTKTKQPTKRERRIEQLKRIEVGATIRRNGKDYTVLAVTRCEDKPMCRTSVGLLEVGKPAEYQREGICLNKGKIITVSNVVPHVWDAGHSWPGEIEVVV